MAGYLSELCASDPGECLARRPANDNIYLFMLWTLMTPLVQQSVRFILDHVPWSREAGDGFRIQLTVKVQNIGARSVRVNLNCGYGFEPSGVQADTDPPTPREEIQRARLATASKSYRFIAKVIPGQFPNPP